MKRIIVIILFIVIVTKVIIIKASNPQYYHDLLYLKTHNYVLGVTAKRGRILDINGKVLVDNKPIKTIYYHDLSNTSVKDKIEIAYSLAEILDVKEATEANQKRLFLDMSQIDLLTDFEHQLYKERKISNDELNDIKYSRIITSHFSHTDKKAAEIYYLMNKDFQYAKKEIKKDVSEEEYALVLEKKLKGIIGEISWERTYPYGDLLKSLFGSVGPIYEENKNEYLAKGYVLSDVVGLSFLEYQYDDYLKGSKALYKVENNELILIKEEQPGNDLYLNIDIDIEQELVNTIKKEILNAKSHPNSEYFKEIYAGVSNPNNGNIIALAGIRYLDNGNFSDITSDLITSSFTVGSVVKGATIALGYNNNLITPGKYIVDSCVKLDHVPQKCSFKRLGKINDITALAYSSNYYQYLIAIGLTNNEYKPNIKLNATKEHFDMYRNTLETYGLGSKTEIDLPKEQTGMRGKIVADDLLLNLAIGQYDTYTLVQLLQYVNTVATGKRYSLRIANHIEKDDEIIEYYSPYVLNELEISSENLLRVQEGMSEVIRKGTGKTAADLKINPVGKTGTSESFYDSNFDGVADVKTISTSLVLYFPKDSPKYSVAIIAPHISHNNNKRSYTYGITKHISSSITNFLFEK